jgi:hypothetical protein
MRIASNGGIDLIEPAFSVVLLKLYNLRAGAAIEMPTTV